MTVLCFEREFSFHYSRKIVLWFLRIVVVADIVPMLPERSYNRVGFF